jgi:hypothetical protein
MTKPLTTHRRANSISLGLFLIGLGIVTYFGIVWPFILLVIGVALLFRQYFRGRLYDMAITTLIFGGLFIFYFFNISSDVLMPVLFTIGGLYLIFREYFVFKDRVGEDRIEDDAQEIEDEEHSK